MVSLELFSSLLFLAKKHHQQLAKWLLPTLLIGNVFILSALFAHEGISQAIFGQIDLARILELTMNTVGVSLLILVH